MGKLSKIADGLVNLAANLGTGRDKASATTYALPRFDPVAVSNAYRGTWLARKIIDIPALDSCRNWRNWNAEQAQISKVEAEEQRLGVKVKLLDAYIKARLFGGAALYIGTGQANSAQPLRPESIGVGGLKHLNVLTRRVLNAGEIDIDPESPNYGKPAYYTMTSSAGQVQIDPSRLVILQGAPKPDAELDAGDGWGDSVLMAIMEAIKQADSTSANIASMVFEAKVDVIKIPDLMSKISDSEYEAELLKRLQLAAMTKGINGTLILDALEEYEQKSANFASLPDVLMSFMQLVSGAADIPVTRLLGQSPAGLSATGESDIRNYYDRIRSGQELVLQPAMQVLDECLIRSALGTRPPDVFYEWRSLWQTTDTERAANGKTTADTINVLAGTKLIPDDVMSKVAVNMLTESGVAPGLESEMQDFIASNPDWQEQQAEEEKAALTLKAQANPDNGNAKQVADADSHYDPNEPRDKDGKWTTGGGDVVRDDDGEPVKFYHGGAADFDPEKLGKGNFNGSVFVRQGKQSGYGAVQHELHITKGQILELDEMENLISDGDGRRKLAKLINLDPDDEVVDKVAEALTDGSNYPDDEDVWSAIGAIDEADAQVEIQKLRGRVAKSLGFGAVRTPDEFDGETVMVVDPGVLRRAKS